MSEAVQIVAACLGSSGLTAIVLAVMQRRWSCQDRQDAIRAGLCDEGTFDDGLGGAYNAWILSHASVDIIEHSYGKDRIEMSEELFAELRRAKRENYEKIYRAPSGEKVGDETSYIFRHHIKRVRRALSYYDKDYDWQSDPDQTVVDYIASMSDGYFMELTEHLFPELSFPRRTYIR